MSNYNFSRLFIEFVFESIPQTIVQAYIAFKILHLEDLGASSAAMRAILLSLVVSGLNVCKVRPPSIPCPLLSLSRLNARSAPLPFPLPRQRRRLTPPSNPLRQNTIITHLSNPPARQNSTPSSCGRRRTTRA